MAPDSTSLLARIREEAFNRRGGMEVRAGRGTAVKAHLLDDEDQNIGNGQIVNPQLIPTVNVETNPPRLLALDALSKTGQMVTVIMTAQAVQNPDPPFNAFPFGVAIGGPIIGIIEFGNGSIATRVEFDVPIGPTFLTNARTPIPRENMDGGVAITVPAGTLRVYARHDGNLIPSNVSGVPTGSVNSTPNLVVNPLELGPISPSPTPVLVKAFASYFTRATSVQPTRTVYVMTAGATGTILNDVINPFPNDSQPIPPFANTVRIIRSFPLVMAPVRIFWYSPATNDPIEAVTIAAGVPSPIIPVPKNASWFTIQSISPATVNYVIAEFGIGL